MKLQQVKNHIIQCIFLLLILVCSQNLFSNNGAETNEQFHNLMDSVSKYQNDSPEQALKYVDLAISNAENLKKTEFIGKAYYEKGVLLFHLSELDSALNCFDKSIIKYLMTNNRLLLAESICAKGKVCLYQSKFEKAIELYNAALNIGNNLNKPKLISKCHNNLGVAYHYTEEFKKALEHYHKSLKIDVKEGDEEGMAFCLDNIGLIYSVQNEYHEAIKYFKKSLSIKTKIGHKSGIAHSYSNLGLAYMNLKNYPLAKKWLTNAYNIFLEMDDPRGISSTSLNLGRVHFKLNEYNPAKEYLNNALKYDRLTNDREGITINLRYLGEILTEEGRLSEANKLLKEGIEIAKDLDNKRQLMHIYKSLSKNAELSGNPQLSLDFFKKYASNKDSVYNETKSKQLKELEIKYQTSEKEKEISFLKNEQRIRELELNRSRNLGISSALIAILIFIIAIILYRRYRLKTRLNQELKTLNKQLEESKKDLKNLNDTKDKFFSILAHDLKTPLISFKNISQSLKENAFRLSEKDLNYFIKELHQNAENLVDLFNNLLQWSLTQTKRKVFNPEKITISEITEDTIKLYKHPVSGKKIKIIDNIKADTIAYADKNMISTVIRNLLSNAIKFSPENSNILIDCIEEEGKYVYSISDSGPGINNKDIKKLFRIDVKNSEIGKNNKNKGPGLGLILSQEFIRLHKQNIWVESKINSGSTFFFTIEKYQD
jgi:signal transduction histidine kinase/Tfp pilus assembly protein PilF